MVRYQHYLSSIIYIYQSAKDQTNRNCKIHGKIEVIHAKVQLELTHRPSLREKNNY